MTLILSNIPGQVINYKTMMDVISITDNLHESFNVVDDVFHMLYDTRKGDDALERLRTVHNNKKKQSESIMLFIPELFRLKKFANTQIKVRQHYMLFMDNLLFFVGKMASSEDPVLKSMTHLSSFLQLEGLSPPVKQSAKERITESIMHIDHLLQDIDRSDGTFHTKLRQHILSMISNQSNYATVAIFQAVKVFMGTIYDIHPSETYLDISEYTKMMICTALFSVLFTKKAEEGDNDTLSSILKRTISYLQDFQLDNRGQESMVFVKDSIESDSVSW
jgi:hypothetical protein